jgi:hypothetical protein
MKNDADRYRENAEFCLMAAKIATAPGLAAAFERLAQTWFEMADELERGEHSPQKNGGPGSRPMRLMG